MVILVSFSEKIQGSVAVPCPLVVGSGSDFGGEEVFSLAASKAVTAIVAMDTFFMAVSCLASLSGVGGTSDDALELPPDMLPDWRSWVTLIPFA